LFWDGQYERVAGGTGLAKCEVFVVLHKIIFNTHWQRYKWLLRCVGT
jgi:hypothetical protein